MSFRFGNQIFLECGLKTSLSGDQRKNQQCLPLLEKNVTDLEKVFRAICVHIKPMTLRDGTEPPDHGGFLSGTFCPLSHD